MVVVIYVEKRKVLDQDHFVGGGTFIEQVTPPISSLPLWHDSINLVVSSKELRSSFVFCFFYFQMKRFQPGNNLKCVEGTPRVSCELYRGSSSTQKRKNQVRRERKKKEKKRFEWLEISSSFFPDPPPISNIRRDWDKSAKTLLLLLVMAVGFAMQIRTQLLCRRSLKRRRRRRKKKEKNGKNTSTFFSFFTLGIGFLWRMTREFKKEKHVLSLGCRCRPSLPVVCLDFFCHCNQVARLVLLLLVQLISSFLTIPFQSRLYFTSIYNLLLF